MCSVASLQEIYSVRCCSSICVCGWVFPAFVIQNLWVCTIASLQEMYSVGCCSSICVCGWMFPAFVIQNLWVCLVASLQEYVCVAGCFCLCNSESVGLLQRILLQQRICVCGWVFPAFVIQNLWVVHNSLAEKNVQHRLLRQYMYVWLDVSCLCNSESVGVLSSLPTRNVQCRLLHQYMYVGLCVSHLLNLASVGVHNHLDG